MAFEISYEEDLVSRIRDLIDGYDIDSILKEYLQNADDAGATELILTFDRRVHQNLKGTKFELGSGPALLLSNNAKFEEEDFENIVKISSQGKTEALASTGLFGQGFTSSFSVSDHPSFVSNGRAYWFDILQKAVCKAKNNNIQGWKIEEDKEDIALWLDTFSMAPHYLKGTVFRLPLRREEEADQSEISHEVFQYEDFLKWCDEWKENSSGLLFLRHVQRILLQEMDTKGEIKKHLEIKTENKEEIQEYRQKSKKSSRENLWRFVGNGKERIGTFLVMHTSIIFPLSTGIEKPRNMSKLGKAGQWSMGCFEGARIY